MSTQHLPHTVLLILALLVPRAAASLDPPADSPAAASSTSSGSRLIVEHADPWADAARLQVWGSAAGVGTSWLAEEYLRQSITDPDGIIAPLCPVDVCPPGIVPHMFGDVLTPEELDDLVAYLQSLEQE